VFLSDMKTALSRYGFNTTDPLTVWLNMGMHDLEMEEDWIFLRTPLTITTVIGTSDYVITQPRISSLKINTYANPLSFLPLKTFQGEVIDYTESGVPEIYTMIGYKTVRLFRRPNAVYTINGFALNEEIDLVDSNSGDTADFIPTNIHHLIVLKAAVYALQAENEEARASDALDQYNQALVGARRRYTDFTGENREVQDVMAYGN
jgi:hypothetical protein